MKTKTGLCATMAFFLLAALALAGLPAAAQAASGPEEAARGAPLVRETISAGWRHICAIRTDGTVACWGRQEENDYGQATPPAGTFTQVSAGAMHTCGLRSDGTVACWGANDLGQSTPPSGTFIQLSAGMQHTCGLRANGTLECWGYNDFGQSTAPAGTFTQVSAGLTFTCALRSDGTVACWGKQYDWTKPAGNPTGTFRQISARGNRACGIRSSGQISCWNTCGDYRGPNYYWDTMGIYAQVSVGSYDTCGQRSDGTVVCWGHDNSSVKTPPEGSFSQVSVGEDAACGVRSDGSVACWGWNGWGQVTAPDGSFGQRQVTAGVFHICTVKADGTLACWGDDGSGNPMTPPEGEFTQVSGGLAHACGLRANGAVACWGDNEYGRATPPDDTSNFLQVSAGWQHSCAIRADGTLANGSPAYGTLACWGDNYSGQTSAPEGGFVEVSAGSLHSCGLQDDGKVACWESNTDGQATPPGDTFRQVSAGNEHSCGIKDDGTLVCWGNSAAGPTTSPEGAFTQVSAGSANTCALGVDGTVACWGPTRYGVTTPPQGSFVQVSVGRAYACAVRSDGMLVCWGASTSLILGMAPAGLPDAAVGAAYSQALSATGGTGPYTFSVDDNALPPGMELLGEGVLSGTPTELGTYDFTVQVVDANDMVATHQYTLVVNLAPQVTANPADLAVAEGSAAAFSATADGTPAPTLQWEVSPDDGANWSPVDGATSNEIAFTASLEQDGNQYRAVFTNVAGSVTTNAATLTVIAVPPTVTLSGPAEANEGEVKSYTFTSSDPGGGPFTLAALGCGANGALSNDSFDAATGKGGFDCTFPDGPATSTVSVQVQDRAQAAGDASPVEVTVANLAPVVGAVTVSPEPSIKASAATASAGFADANPGDTPFTCSVDYGDGSGAVASTVAGTTCTGPAHTYAAVGSYTVAVAVTDKDGGTGSASAVHTVIYAFSGFFQPVDSLPVVNVANAGRSIPVKFSLGGNQGLNIFAAGYPKVELQTCTSAPVDALEAYADGSGLSYDPQSQQYNYVWKTQKAWAGKCGRLKMLLVDGTPHEAEFKFK
jgi:alpha-tubulin suppressor-like RCC1 family protein